MDALDTAATVATMEAVTEAATAVTEPRSGDDSADSAVASGRRGQCSNIGLSSGEAEEMRHEAMIGEFCGCRGIVMDDDR